MQKISTRIPVMFQEMEEYDSRFTRVKIWLMHTGENANGSYFSKEAVEEAIPTLANTPILGYVDVNSRGEDDFAGHKMGIQKVNDEWTLKYMGSAYGTIPEENNAKFEMRICDDGIEREFLTCEGILWSGKFSDVKEIFEKSDGVKSQSMELDDDYEGFFDKSKKLFHFSKFRFYGACVLGLDVKPAMKNASIETEFSQEEILADIHRQIQEKMEEFKAIFSNRNKDIEGGNAMDEKLVLLTQYSLTREDVEAKGINFEEISLEDLETSLKEFSANPEPTPEPTPNPEPTPAPTFSLTSEQLENELKLELSEQKVTDDWGWSYQAYYFVDYMPESNVVIAYQCDNGVLVSFNYTLTGDKVEVDFSSIKRMKVEYVPMDIPTDGGDGDEPLEFTLVSKEFHNSKVDSIQSKVTEFEQVQSKLTETQTKFQELEAEVVDLRNFKTNFEKSERENAENQLFEQFSSDLTEEELQPYKETASQFSIEDLETQLFALVGKKKKSFSAKTKDKGQPSVKIAFGMESGSSNGMPYEHLFEKFGYQKRDK